MLVEWTLRIVVPIFKGRGDTRNCSCYGAVKRWYGMVCVEHCMVAERVFEKRLHRIVNVDEMQFGFISERGTIDAVFILRRNSIIEE